MVFLEGQQFWRTQQGHFLKQCFPFSLAVPRSGKGSAVATPLKVKRETVLRRISSCLLYFFVYSFSATYGRLNIDMVFIKSQRGRRKEKWNEITNTSTEFPRLLLRIRKGRYFCTQDKGNVYMSWDVTCVFYMFRTQVDICLMSIRSGNWSYS